MRLKILCLHGSKQCAEIFSQRIEPLVKASRGFADFVFVDGPVELPLEPGQTVPMRSWWKDSSEPAMKSIDDAIEQAADGVVFDGVLGFSQGAALAAFMAARLNDSPHDAAVRRPCTSALRFVITAGGYAITEVSVLGAKTRLPVPSLHMAGEKDDCVPPQESEKLALLFQASTVHRHSQSHVFPCKTKDVSVCESFLKAQLALLETGRSSTGAIPAGSAPAIPPFEATEDQKDEIEALQAIFMDEIIEFNLHPPSVRIKFGIPRASDTPLSDRARCFPCHSVRSFFALNVLLWTPQGQRQRRSSYLAFHRNTQTYCRSSQVSRPLSAPSTLVNAHVALSFHWESPAEYSADAHGVGRRQCARLGRRRARSCG